MLLAREFVDYISRQIIKKMAPKWIETNDVNVASDFIATVIEEDLAVEDQLNDEVRNFSASTPNTCGAKASATRKCFAASRTP